MFWIQKNSSICPSPLSLRRPCDQHSGPQGKVAPLRSACVLALHGLWWHCHRRGCSLAQLNQNHRSLGVGGQRRGASPTRPWRLCRWGSGVLSGFSGIGARRLLTRFFGREGDWLSSKELGCQGRPCGRLCPCVTSTGGTVRPCGRLCHCVTSTGGTVAGKSKLTRGMSWTVTDKGTGRPKELSGNSGEAGHMKRTPGRWD